VLRVLCCVLVLSVVELLTPLGCAAACTVMFSRMSSLGTASAYAPQQTLISSG
jgi:hypothetical protein